MAETKKAPMEGPNGVDQWTSNGYGLILNGKQVKPPKESEIDEIEEE